jgi:hypothetical protein
MIYKVAGEDSILDDLLKLITKWKKEPGGDHIKAYPPPEIKNGEKFPIIWNEKFPDYSGEVFITYSKSGGGENRNEVRTWNNVFKRLDAFPHIIKLYKGRMPSEVFDTEVLHKNEKGLSEEEVAERKLKRKAIEKEKEKSKNTLKEFKILPIKYSYLKEFWNEKNEEYESLKNNISNLENKIKLQNERIKAGKSKGLQTAENDKIKLRYESELKIDKENLSSLLGEIKAEDLEYVVQKIKEGFDFSMVDEENKANFYLSCAVANNPERLSVNHERNIEEGIYSEICSYMSWPSNDEVFENISGTLYHFICENKLTLKGDIIEIPDNIDNVKLSNLLKALKFLKTGKLKI